ncbi:hypothetical protein [Williamsia deligens]|uniref:Uncharacterized protein n=1 Tax=Williamsia deligens TaxID=321325 RepID=A0ABW3GA88_9NOCA|nr:hypothetical protein [Williamsia deligens]
MEIDDPLGGARLVVATPDGDARLWRDYLDGAHASYAAHGVAAALDRDAVADGHDTAVFFAVLDEAGVCRGGLRAQGPYLRADESHAVVEWAGSDGLDAVVRAIETRLPEGVIEVKAAWVDPTAPDPRATAGVLSRLALPLFAVTGAGYIMATSAEHSLRRWESGGGRIDETVCATAYPDERYSTRLMWWDARTMEVDADPRMLSVMRDQVRLMRMRSGDVAARMAA